MTETTKDAPASSRFGAVKAGASVVLLGMALVWSMPATAQSPAPSDMPDPCLASSMAPTGEPVVFKGGKQNAGNTQQATLAPGDYELVLTGKARESSNIILALVGPGMPEYDSIWNEDTGEGTYTLSTYLYEVEGGEYHLRYDLPRGSWSVTISPV